MGARHAAVANAHHVAHALAQQFFGDGKIAPFGHSRRADGAGIAQDDHPILGNIEIGVVERAVHLGGVVENDGRAAVAQEFGIGG